MPATELTASYYSRKLSSDQGLQGFGTIWEARRVGINYEINGFSISAILMRQDAAAVTGLFTAADSGFSNLEFSEIMPRIVAAYSISSFKVVGTYTRERKHIPHYNGLFADLLRCRHLMYYWIHCGSGASQVDKNPRSNCGICFRSRVYVKSSVTANNTVTGENDRRYHVDAGHLMVAANPRIANNTRLITSGFYSVNGGLYQMIAIGGGHDPYEAVRRDLWALPQLKEPGKGDMYNTSVYGGAIALNVSGFEAGLGIQSAGSDAWEENQTGIAAYGNYTYRVSGFSVTPEVGYLHGGNSARMPGAPKETRGFHAGVQFRFDI